MSLLGELSVELELPDVPLFFSSSEENRLVSALVNHPRVLILGSSSHEMFDDSK